MVDRNFDDIADKFAKISMAQQKVKYVKRLFGKI